MLYFSVLYFFVLYIFVLYLFVLYFFMLYFFVSGFFVVLKQLYYLQQILMIHVWQLFGHTLKNKVFPRVGKLGLIHCLVVCVCFFINYLGVRKLNCLLILFLLLIKNYIHKCYCSIRFSVAFNTTS